MDLVVHPPSGLLDAQLSPLIFKEKASVRHLLVYVFGEKNMSVFVAVVLVLLTVLNFFWKMRHLKF